MSESKVSGGNKPREQLNWGWRIGGQGNLSQSWSSKRKQVCADLQAGLSTQVQSPAAGENNLDHSGNWNKSLVGLVPMKERLISRRWSWGSGLACWSTARLSVVTLKPQGQSFRVREYDAYTPKYLLDGFFTEKVGSPPLWRGLQVKTLHNLMGLCEDDCGYTFPTPYVHRSSCCTEVGLSFVPYDGPL